MQEYICHFTKGQSTARRVYHAPDLATAMAAHNSAMPDHRKSVLKWEGPTGIIFLMHDSKMSL